MDTPEMQQGVSFCRKKKQLCRENRTVFSAQARFEHAFSAQPAKLCRQKPKFDYIHPHIIFTCSACKTKPANYELVPAINEVIGTPMGTVYARKYKAVCSNCGGSLRCLDLTAYNQDLAALTVMQAYRKPHPDESRKQVRRALMIQNKEFVEKFWDFCMLEQMGCLLNIIEYKGRKTKKRF